MKRGMLDAYILVVLVVISALNLAYLFKKIFI